MPKITVIEDNDADILLLEDALRNAGIECEIRVIGDGQEARRYITGGHTAQSRPDLILVDFNIPKEDGLSLLAAVRESEALRAVPVIVWSSTCSDRDQKAATAFGVVDFVVKPGRLEEWGTLGERLRDLLRGAPPAPPR
jgi:CheY-like chemotaxis protein